MEKPVAEVFVRDNRTSNPDWHAVMSRHYHSGDALLDALQITSNHALATSSFPMRVPPGFADLMRPGDPDDPLLRQVLPTADEERVVDGYSTDPVGDLDSAIAPGVLQKYEGRALLIVTGACAIHCRYCFRRAYPYADGSLSHGELRAAIDSLTADPTISEIIFSGGDPLMLSNRKLSILLNDLTRISHIRRIRFHTRIPVVLPERIDSPLLDQISACPLPVIIVIHSNHAREIGAGAAKAVSALIESGAILLNQSVLLSGVNDSVETLTDLSERLFEIGVLPYYLHQLDRVAGAAHFDVDDKRAMELIDAVADRLPGYLVPRLVRETPGDSAKRPLRGMP